MSLVCPAHLPPLAREKWNELVAIKRDMRQLSVADAPALELFAVQYAHWRAAIEGAKSGHVIKQGDALAQNPYMLAARLCETKMTALLAKLGLSHVHPARTARPQVDDLEPAAVEDPFAGLELVG